MDYKIAISYLNNIGKKATKSHSLANSLSYSYRNVSILSLNDLITNLYNENKLQSIFSNIDYLVLDENDIKTIENPSKLINIIEKFVIVIYINTNDLKKNIIQKIKIYLKFYNRDKADDELLYVYNLTLLDNDLSFNEKEVKVLNIRNFENYEKYYYLVNRDEALCYNYKLWTELNRVIYAESIEKLRDNYKVYLKRKLEKLHRESKSITKTIRSLSKKQQEYNEQINKIEKLIF